MTIKACGGRLGPFLEGFDRLDFQLLVADTSHHPRDCGLLRWFGALSELAPVGAAAGLHRSHRLHFERRADEFWSLLRPIDALSKLPLALIARAVGRPICPPALAAAHYSSRPPIALDSRT